MTEEECPEFTHQLPRDRSESYSAAKAKGFKGSLQDWWDHNTRHNKALTASIKNSYLHKGRGVKQTLKAKNIRSSIPLALQHALLDADVDYPTAQSLGYEFPPEAWATFKTLFYNTLSKADRIKPMENVPQLRADIENVAGDAPVPETPTSVETALASFFTPDGKLLVPTMTCIYPIDQDRKYDMPTQLFITAMLKFYKVLTPNGGDDISIYTFKGIAGSDELLWVRFETPAGPASFAILESNKGRWVQACLEDETLAWCTQGNLNKAMQARDMHLNVSKAIFEFPLAYFMVPFEANPMDELFSGDYEVYENAVARLKVSVWDRLREITDLTAALNVSVKHKDHDLYLVFKAAPGFAKMNVILEKVSPILPESGEISLGDNPAATFVPAEGDKRTALTVKKIMVLGKQINQQLVQTRKLISQHPIIQAEYAQFVKTMLLAATHFMKLVYKFRGDDGVELVEVEADKILRALKEHGGNVGLDLNSWIVWEYDGVKQPVRVTTPELCFNDLLHAKFTESFIEAIYAHLMGLGNPLTRPYHYREEVDVNDGIEVGSVRRV